VEKGLAFVVEAVLAYSLIQKEFTPLRKLYK
jgi:hypothetical protein